MSQRQQRRPFKRTRSSDAASGVINGGGLEAKVAETGGRLGYGLEEKTLDGENAATRNRGGVYGSRSVSSLSRAPRLRQFKATTTSNKENDTNMSTNGVQGDDSVKTTATPKNPYSSSGRTNSRRPMTSSASTLASTKVSAARTNNNKVGLRSGVEHIVCAISENLAKETCVTSLDAGSPTSLLITKQGNGQTYAETLAYLELLQPDEVLLNEGRRNSQLAKKVLSLYKQPQSTVNPIDADRNRRHTKRKSSSRRQRHFATTAFDQEPSHAQDLLGDSDDEDIPSGGLLAGPCSTSTVVKFVPRAYFDQTKGAELLQRIARSDSYDPSLMEEYILLSSAHAVLLYTQLCLGANFAKNSIHLNVNAGGNNRMNIDRSSLLHLELLANAKTGKMANSLIGTIDCTKTTVGSRLLRTNLMAPPMRVETINTRLDLVDAFLGDEEFFYTVMEKLEALPDVDKMLINVALVPWKRGKGKGDTAVTARVASKGISALVCIKSILGAMPAFAGALEEQLFKLEDHERVAQNEAARNRPRMAFDNVSTITDGSLLIGLGSTSRASIPPSGLRNQLLRAIVLTMKHSALPEVMTAILDIFVESTTFSRNAHAMRHQECFALKPKTDGMMDIIRKAFLANVDDIYKLADEYAESFGIKVVVKEKTSRGYYLAIPADIADDLPQVFIQPVKSGKFIHCTTEEVHSLNARAQENVQDLLMMTHERIQEVLDVARSHYDALASLSDAIALLDMCHCFADNVASSRDRWCRPIVSDNTDRGGGEISILNGRYGIDTSKAGLPMNAGSFVPNDTYASRSKHFTVITGVNGSGKSTYLKQLAIIVVLAHCGSYVPADEARIPVRDRLCTRIGTADDQEHNISTFMLEMKEAAFICKHATDKSLILIDELGRATSNEDGVAIAWAVSEHLLLKRVMTFFVTHYPQLSKLSLAYPAVQNQHMDSIISGEGDTEVGYTHKIRSGPCTSASDYGVEMAPTCGWPGDVVKEARKIRSEIESKLPDASLCLVDTSTPGGANADKERRAYEALLVLAQQLCEVGSMFNPDNFDVEAARRVLERIRLGCVPQNNPELKSTMKKLVSTETTAAQASAPPNSSRPGMGPATTTEAHSGGNVVSQGKSEDVKMGERPNDGPQSDTSSCSTSSLSDSDSDSSSGSDTD